MAGLAVNVAVIHEGKILLTQREDFETWILPSGGVEDGESIAQAAIRETKEETGLDVELTRLVGIYSRLSNMAQFHAVLFSANLLEEKSNVSQEKPFRLNGLNLINFPPHSPQGINDVLMMRFQV